MRFALPLRVPFRWRRYHPKTFWYLSSSQLWTAGGEPLEKSIELQVRTWTCSSCKNMQPIYTHSRCFLENNFKSSEYIIMHETSRFLRNFSRFHNFLPDLETNSMSFPSRISSSFCAVEALHVTPGNMTTFRVNFSPKKFLTSTFVKLGSIATLMGKWAYTDLILYL